MARTNGFAGMAFSSMSDTFLLECFNELSEKTASTRVNCEDWMDEWQDCEDEILARLSRVPLD